MPNTSQGLPFPSDSDPIDVAGDIGALASVLDTKIVDLLTRLLRLEDRITISSANPSGGVDGDIWLKY